MSAALRVWTCWSVIALQLASVWAATGNCKAGGAGYALAFDGLDGTTVSMKWDFEMKGIKCRARLQPMIRAG